MSLIGALFVATLALAGTDPASPDATPATVPTAAPLPSDLPKGIAKILAKADGSTPENAIKVRSVGQEYEIIRALGYRPGSQALVTDKGKAYDRLTVTHAQTGEQREFWFDISSFYGRILGF